MTERDPSARLALLQGAGTQPEMVSMARNGSAIYAEADVPDVGPVGFEATDIRRERTGVHARIRVRNGFGDDAHLLAYDVLNIDRDSSRKALAAAVGHRLGENRAGKLARSVKIRLDDVCSRLWQVWCSQGGFERVKGDPTPYAPAMIDPWIAEGGNILYAPGESGKTFVAMAWALSLQSGHGPWRVREPMRVAWLDLETGMSTARKRLHRVGTVLGVSDEIDLLSRPGWSLSDLGPLIEHHDHDVLFIDSISRSGEGDLNENVTANQTVDLLNRLCVAWVGIGHTPDANPDKLYGSVHWINGARRAARMSLGGRGGGELGLGLEMSKINDGPRPPAEVWRLKFDGDGLTGLERANPADFPDLPARFYGTLSDRLYNLLTSTGPMSLSDAAEELDCDRANLYRYVRSSRFVRLPSTKGSGQKVQYAAASGLQE